MIAQALELSASAQLRNMASIGGNLMQQGFTDRQRATMGSLVSLGNWSTVGNLMGFLFGRGMFVEGLFARIMYRSLRLMHEQALGGTRRALLAVIARAFAHRIDPPAPRSSRQPR